MSEETECAVSRWFGARFSELHPLLQALHRHGGILRGVVEIRTGSGVAAWLGRRLARSLGIPVDQPRLEFTVSIQHEAGALNWTRTFGNGAVMVSRFEAVGAWPHGYWREQTGPLSLDMTVDVIDQGWEWRRLRVRFNVKVAQRRDRPPPAQREREDCRRSRWWGEGGHVMARLSR